MYYVCQEGLFNSRKNIALVINSRSNMLEVVETRKFSNHKLQSSKITDLSLEISGKNVLHIFKPFVASFSFRSSHDLNDFFDKIKSIIKLSKTETQEETHPPQETAIKEGKELSFSKGLDLDNITDLAQVYISESTKRLQADLTPPTNSKKNSLYNSDKKTNLASGPIFTPANRIFKIMNIKKKIKLLVGERFELIFHDGIHLDYMGVRKPISLLIITNFRVISADRSFLEEEYEKLKNGRKTEFLQEVSIASLLETIDSSEERRTEVEENSGFDSEPDYKLKRKNLINSILSDLCEKTFIIPSVLLLSSNSQNINNRVSEEINIKSEKLEGFSNDRGLGVKEVEVERRYKERNLFSQKNLLNGGWDKSSDSLPEESDKEESIRKALRKPLFLSMNKNNLTAALKEEPFDALSIGTFFFFGTKDITVEQNRGKKGVSLKLTVLIKDGRSLCFKFRCNNLWDNVITSVFQSFEEVKRLVQPLRNSYKYSKETAEKKEQPSEIELILPLLSELSKIKNVEEKRINKSIIDFTKIINSGFFHTKFHECPCYNPIKTNNCNLFQNGSLEIVNKSKGYQEELAQIFSQNNRVLLHDYLRIIKRSEHLVEVSESNLGYILCSTYPPYLMVPTIRQELILKIKSFVFNSLNNTNKEFSNVSKYINRIFDDLENITSCLNNFILSLLQESAGYRSISRVPVVVWANKAAFLLRSSQPRMGMLSNRSSSDELFISIVRALSSDPSNFLIVDARSSLSATGNTLMGKGTERVENYKGARLVYCGIGNIHKVRADRDRMFDLLFSSKMSTSKDSRKKPSTIESQNKRPSSASNLIPNLKLLEKKSFENTDFKKGASFFIDILDFMKVSGLEGSGSSKFLPSNPSEKLGSSKQEKSFLSELESSGWLTNLRKILKGAVEVSRSMLKGVSVLVHCSDGWDRTSQLSSLAQLILDPYYRTYEGFEKLVRKEWLDFGHMFGTKTGGLKNSDFYMNSKGSKKFSSLKVDPDTTSNKKPGAKRRMSFSRQTSKKILSLSRVKDEEAPIFLQFLDCVHQLCRQNKTAFEFTDSFLVELMDAVHDGTAGDFLFDCRQERELCNLIMHTTSFWSSPEYSGVKERCKNKNYSFGENDDTETDQHTLEVLFDIRYLRLWEKYFFRFI